MIPAGLRAKEVVTLLGQLQENAYLMDMLQSSPVADQTLEQIAKRLQKNAGKNKTVAQRSSLLAQRRKKAAENGELRPLWAKSPADCPFGIPLELTNDAFGIDDTVARKQTAYRVCPERFHVAMGLALQGLGRTPVKTNLLPKQQEGLKGKLGRFLRTKEAVIDTAWGIDYDERELRVIAIQFDEKQGVRIHHCQSVPIATEEVVRADEGDGESRAALATTVREVCEELSLMGQQVCLSVPGIHVLFRLMDIPKSTKDKVESAIRFESKHQIPFNLDETIWDYHILKEIDEEDPDQLTIPVNLLAVKEARVVERLAIFQEAGVDVRVAQSSVAALYNLSRHRQNTEKPATSPNSGNKAVAWLDLGYDSSSFTVAGEDIFWSRSWYRGVANCESALRTALGLNAQDAAIALQQPTKLPRLSAMASALMPCFENMSREVAVCLNTFQANYPDITIERIIGTGSGIHVHGLIPYLRRGRFPCLEPDNVKSRTS
jgi:type IV pilus assembly protein PilM